MADEPSVRNIQENRFFCHKCCREISAVLPDYKCPTCQCGFIEALEADGDLNNYSDSEFGYHDVLEGVGSLVLNLQRDLTRFQQLLPREARRPDVLTRHLSPFLQDFMGSLVGLGLENQMAMGPRVPTMPSMLVLGNPGDYAWGREGLDAIVTQLLNQMDSAGPPPLDQEKINEIPLVKITNEQTDMNLQCSVCWEDFEIDEQVRKLACEHLYHENCIVPWLELHGTCPICRKALSEEVAALSNVENVNNTMGNHLSLASLFRVGNQSMNDTNAPSTSRSGSGTTSSSSSSSNSPPEFVDFDMDFD